VVRGVEWGVRRRERLDSFYRRAGCEGGDRGQREGARAVSLANGRARGDVWAVLGGDAIGLASADSAGEGRVERERARVERGSPERAHVLLGYEDVSILWASGLVGMGLVRERGKGPGVVWRGWGRAKGGARVCVKRVWPVM
jgi:hypothetical protein